MSVLKKFAFALLLTSLAVVAMGCGGRKSDVKLAKCEGTVNYNGSPVEGAKVTMSSSQGMCTGTTDASGKFKMETVEGGRPYPGAPIGTLKVAISKTEGGDVPSIEPPADKNDQKAQEEYMAKMLEYQKKKTAEGDKGPKDLLPAKYANIATSELTVELTKEGKTDIVFDLKD